MKMKIQTKLTLSYILVAFICIGLISIFSNILLEKQFQNYVKENQDQQSKNIIEMISKQYQADGIWKKEAVESIGVSALENGFILNVKDVNGNELWSATTYNSGMCQGMLAHMAENMSSRYPNWKGTYVENKYPILLNNKIIGNIKIGYYGPFYYTDTDLIFINTLNRVLIGIGLLSFVLSFIIGWLISERLSRPIIRVIDTAQEISKGNFESRSNEKTTTKELYDLSKTINNLAKTLQTQEILRKRLTQDVAHELRTPLATLQSHLEAMIDGIWEPSAERLESCHEETMRLGRLIGDLEKIAKYESENLILNKEKFNLNKLINTILYNIETQFLNKEIQVKFKGKEIFIIADKDKISQVLINLISNAVKYTNLKGIIEISINKKEQNIEIIIKDSGQGISQEDLPYIFERFYRADKSRNRATGGSGIGLTIVKCIIDAHKGEIIVNSKKDVGTEVKVTLPIVYEDKTK